MIVLVPRYVLAFSILVFSFIDASPVRIICLISLLNFIQFVMRSLCEALLLQKSVCSILLHMQNDQNIYAIRLLRIYIGLSIKNNQQELHEL